MFPSDPRPDATLALLAEGYRFIGNRCDRLGTDAFGTRLMLRPAICTRGCDAAAMMYHPDRFTRAGSMPPTTVRLLQELGSVQLLDGAAHRQRKRMFLDITSPGTFRSPAGDHRVAVAGAIPGVATPGRSKPLSRGRGRPLPRRLHLDGRAPAIRRGEPPDAGVLRNDRRAGSIGPGMWRAQLQRRSTERWARGIVASVRAAPARVPDDVPVRRLAEHRDATGEPLDDQTAAVELIDLLRPTVAVARFIVLAALTLRRYPDARAFVVGSEEEQTCFVQEVRRFYPFFPFIGGRARQPFEWHGRTIARDTGVVFDIYGTNHDARIWDAPDEFRPARFRGWRDDAYTLVPQGAGDHATTHRGPGEWITIALIRQAARLLATECRYEVPEQD